MRNRIRSALSRKRRGANKAVGGVFGALLLGIIGASFLEPIASAVNTATGNLTGSTATVAGLITLIFAVGVVYGLADHFGMV